MKLSLTLIVLTLYSFANEPRKGKSESLEENTEFQQNSESLQKHSSEISDQIISDAIRSSNNSRDAGKYSEIRKQNQERFKFILTPQIYHASIS